MILQFGRSQLGVVTFGMLRTRRFSSPRSGACACGHAFVRLCARAHSDVLPSLTLIGWDPVPLPSPTLLASLLLLLLCAHRAVGNFVSNLM